MSSRHNLNDNTSDKFEFSIGGLDYDLKYPTLEEIEPIQDLVKSTEELKNDKSLSDEEKAAKLAELEQKANDQMYSFVVPVGHDTPIQETIKKQPFPVVKAFNKMMSEQLSAE